METPQVKDLEEAKKYMLSQGLEQIVSASEGRALGVNEKLETRVPFKPDLVDLCRLHRFVLENKRTTVLEFGTGWSTWVLTDALRKNKNKYAEDVVDLRRNNPFELHVVDDEPEFIGIAKSRLPSELKSFIWFHEKKVIMDCFNGRICTLYESLPLVSPDFIYIDGPNQFSVEGEVGGWSTRHKDMMPMSADILRIEHFLTPGTILIFDGRAANARFVSSNLQREWEYKYDQAFDQHVFMMSENPLGKYNKRQLDFYG